MIEGPADCLLAQFDSGLNPDCVGFPPRCQLRVGMQRQRKVPSFNTGTALEPPHQGGAPEFVSPVFLEGTTQYVLGVVMLGEGACGAKDLHN